jgi:hypothetical protein
LPTVPASSKVGINEASFAISYTPVGGPSIVSVNTFNPSDIIAVNPVHVDTLYPQNGQIGTLSQTNPGSLNNDPGPLLLTVVAGSPADTDLAAWLQTPPTALPSGQLVTPERTFTITYKTNSGDLIPVTLVNGRIRGVNATGTSTGSTLHGKQYVLGFDSISLGDITPPTP